MKSALILEIPEFPCNSMYDRWKQSPVTKQLDYFSRFDTIPVCDGQTETDRQTHNDSKYRASIASRGKRNFRWAWVSITHFFVAVCSVVSRPRRRLVPCTVDEDLWSRADTHTNIAANSHRGGTKRQLPRAQQDRGRKRASPELFYN